jgi:hypothetical protein
VESNPNMVLELTEPGVLDELDLNQRVTNKSNITAVTRAGSGGPQC